MRASASAALAATMLALGSGAVAAEPEPRTGPAPAWVIAPAIPPMDSKGGDTPFQFLLSSAQERILPDGIEQYIEYAAAPLTTGGLQALGNVTLPWNVERTDLTIHKISILRGGATIDLLKSAETLVLRRENNLEKAMLDGTRTVVIPARGLQVGDILSVSYTYKTRPSSLGLKPEELQNLLAPVPIAWMERRFLVADDVKVNWKLAPSIAPPQIVRRSGATEHRFVATDVKPVPTPKFTPPRYVAPLIQVSAYKDWSAVADLVSPLFDKSRRPGPASPLLREADKIAASTGDPGGRMLAALRLAQEQVRYVALLLGDGAYVPMSADDTWERRFGDCKGKTSLLLALLDRLGIEAEPMLVSSQNDDRLKEQLPSLLLFDHVLVRARIGSKTYYLDAVGYGQRTLEELAITPFSYGLPLRRGGVLEETVQGELTAPTREASIVWDGSKGLEGEIPFEATLTLRGVAAAAMRATLSGATDSAEFDTAIKGLVPRIRNQDLEILERRPEDSGGGFVVRLGGKSAMDWAPFEGRREHRYTFTQSTLEWQPDFDRSSGPGKDWPVLIGSDPHWERLTETIILPGGGEGYSLEASALDKTVAGSRITRTVSKSGARVTMVADFRHLKREISAEEARSGAPLLEEIGRDFAYVVGPRLPKGKAGRGR
ncbi:MAG TPA: DUF3857 domain-containing protein [Allosphingosinicella sp.]|jgi:hypothetical protein|nr:DUF3857 domain-containing protein [Allosphingosinicella sp.]